MFACRSDNPGDDLDLSALLMRRPALLDSADMPVQPAPPPILLIDPNAARAEQLSILLDRPTQRLIGEVVAVLVALAVHSPQLVLLVHDPPALDAVALCQTLQATSDVPILVLMMTPGSNDRIRALRAGADDAIPFPVAPAELQARIAAVLRRCGQVRLDAKTEVE